MRETTCFVLLREIFVRLEQTLASEVLVRLAVEHVTLRVLELLFQCRVPALGVDLVLELFVHWQSHTSQQKQFVSKRKSSHSNIQSTPHNLHWIASRMSVMSWKCLVLGILRQRMPNAWRHSWKCRSNARRPQ